MWDSPSASWLSGSKHDPSLSLSSIDFVDTLTDVLRAAVHLVVYADNRHDSVLALDCVPALNNLCPDSIDGPDHNNDR